MAKLNLSSVKRDYNEFLKVINSIIKLEDMSSVSILESRTLEPNRPIKFLAEKTALRHARPTSSARVEVSINFRLSYPEGVFDSYYKDMDSSNMNIQFRAINQGEENSNYFGFHFDLHKNIVSSNPENSCKEPRQLHPRYHTQFLQNPSDVHDFDYGNSLQLDIPRFTHFPMDFILGISFVLANFTPDKFQELSENETFIRIQRKYQTQLWKPYIEGLNELLSNPQTSEFKSAKHLHPYWL